MKFAVIENNVVINTVVADSVEIAETITGATCVEYTDENVAHIGLGYVDGVFELPAYPDGYFDEVPTDTE